MKRYAVAMALSTVMAVCVSAAPALAQQKTVKVCTEEWRANKADNQAKGITEKTYVEQCRAGSAAAAPNSPSSAPSNGPAAAAAAPPATQGSPATATQTVPRRTTAGQGTSSVLGANEYASEAQAKLRCPTDTVVWANTSSKIYHFAGHKDYGNTKRGAYMCEKDTAAAGMRAPKNEKHP
jgi:hypothetical protein